MTKKNQYLARGVSADKKGLKSIVSRLGRPKVFENAFCQGMENPFHFLKGDLSEHYYFHHADGIGSKGSLAYLYHLESGSVKHFAHLIQDAWVMNIDDLLCVGANDGFTFSTIISRNKKLIDDEVLALLIQEENNLIDFFNQQKIKVFNLGGETADMGDVTKTLAIDATCTTFVAKDEFVDNGNIAPGQTIVALASFGKTIYEEEYNSGIGCNGLTSAKHDLLQGSYAKEYLETYDALMDRSLVYQGDYSLTDALAGTPLDMGRALLSPTRTYLPVVRAIFDRLGSKADKIKGLIHNSGGGQTKCLNFSKKIHYIKDNLFEFPPIFKCLSQKTSLREMFQVYNCGHRLEIYTDEKTAREITAVCADFDLAAKVIGHTERNSNPNNALTISHENETIKYES